MNYKKLTLGGCGSVIIIAAAFWTALIYYLTLDERIAKDPKKIAAEAGFELPDYVVVEQTDNMNRSSSAWSDYQWTLRLVEPLTEEQIQHLNTLVTKDRQWSYRPTDRTYVYDTNPALEDDRPVINIHMRADGEVWLEYMWWDFFA